MPVHVKEYRRLPGKGIRQQGVVTVGRTRLWLGRDHLLLVDSQWFTEDYKRFYFGDIQAFVIRQTAKGKVTNIVLAALAFLPLLAALSYGLNGSGDYGLALFWGIVAGILLTWLAINTIMGPTCVCHIKTAVQTENLPSLGRLWRARKVLRRLRPLIAEAQGEFPAAQPAAGAAAAEVPAGAPPEAGEPPSAISPDSDPSQPPAGT